jgi:hypothetical protein
LQIAFDSSEVDNSFDSIIGCIEDIVIGDEFQEIQVDMWHQYNLKKNQSIFFDKTY